jgi:opacity protein-like surface antigen
MKRVAVALLIAAVAGTSAWAQKTKAGDKAWLFTLSGLSDLGVGGYNGGLGLLYYLNDDLGLTVGLGFSTSSTTTKAPTGGGEDETKSSLELTLSPGVRFNIASSGPVVGYAGVGVLVGISSETTENPKDIQAKKVEISSTSIGAGVTVGAEWFAWSNVSLGASYSAGCALDHNDCHNAFGSLHALDLLVSRCPHSGKREAPVGLSTGA